MCKCWGECRLKHEECLRLPVVHLQFPNRLQHRFCLSCGFSVIIAGKAILIPWKPNA